MAVLDRTLSDDFLPPAGFDRPVNVVDVELDLLAADLDASNSVLLFQFPDVAFVPNNGASIVIDNDDLEGATPAGEVNIGFGDSDGVLDITTNAAVDWMQAAAVNNLAAVIGEGGFIDVGGKYLTFVVSTAAGANPAAGSVRVGIIYTQNVIKAT